MTTDSDAAARTEHAAHSCCGHDHGRGHVHVHDDGDPHAATRCISCGAPIGEGVGHGRSMGRPLFAFVGGFLIVNSFLLELIFPDFTFAARLSAALGAIALALPIVATAIRDLIEGRVYMNELVALAILAAFTSGNFQTAGIIAFFLLITIIIESHTASGAQRSIEDLIRLTPHAAHRLKPDGSEEEVEVASLALNDVISVRPGENFPIDGTILSGESAVNQASITGESMPEDKAPGDEVYAGTMNISGSLQVRVTRLGKDTTLGKVQEMIRSAERNKTAIVRIIDRYAAYYTPLILMLAVVTWWLTGGNMDRVIALLVISCPCAVVLATPTTIVAAVAAAARLGVLIKNISHLELAGRIRTVVFDKTGTLTEGRLSVARLTPFGDVQQAELLRLAIALERYSNHPTAQALQRLAAEVGIKPPEATGFQEEHGRGVLGVVEGRRVLIGRAAWLKSLGVEPPEVDPAEQESMSTVYVACDGSVVGWIGFRDRIRKEAFAAISELKRIGVSRCAMVTGDRAGVAAGIAAKLNMDDVRSDCLPQTKAEYVEDLKKTTTVAVVGDGVNDAPALAAGDLGIAMGAIGSDIAINSASIALMTNDLRRVPFLILLSRKTSSVMYQNLAFGLLFVLCGIVLSVFGRLGPVTAAVLHSVSTLIVIFNSARLVRAGEDAAPAPTGRRE